MVVFDTGVHPLMMGLEEHLVAMFRDDFEFGEAPSHLGAASKPTPVEGPVPQDDAAVLEAAWTADAERELKKIPFFVRGKARRNTEAYAAERGTGAITVETLYEAKAHYGR